MDYLTARQLLGDRIRNIRKQKNIKQERLAELIDKTTEHVSFIERGERSPSFEVLVDMANALNISLSYLTNIEAYEQASEIIVPAPIPLDMLPHTIEEPVKPENQRKGDLERLQNGLENVRALQQLANEYDITDIFQDNGGKVLQLLILLGLKQSKGREGNDAVDEDGNEYELKTINRSLNRNAGITTHHHITKDIINKYRKVTWYVGIYESIELVEIWKVHPSKLEEVFTSWEKWLDEHEGESRNNPKFHYVIFGKVSASTKILISKSQTIHHSHLHLF